MIYSYIDSYTFHLQFEKILFHLKYTLSNERIYQFTYSHVTVHHTGTAFGGRLLHGDKENLFLLYILSLDKLYKVNFFFLNIN